MKYNYSNGLIEGINNYIKVLKRIAFGCRSFVRMRNRILISHNLLKKKKEYRAA
ncbi:transposase [Mogibacterium sp.]|uniref:transposase n=1 Tax=Mogibacterium sp. TaxID=2049035 RepID=UPI003FA5C02C